MHSRIEQIATPDAVRGFEETLAGPVSYAGDNKPNMNFRVVQNALIATNTTITNMRAVMGLLKDEVVEFRQEIAFFKNVSDEIKAIRTLIEDVKKELPTREDIKNLICDSKRESVNPTEMFKSINVVRDAACDAVNELVRECKTKVEPTEVEPAKSVDQTSKTEDYVDIFEEIKPAAQETKPETKQETKPKRGRKPANRLK